MLVKSARTFTRIQQFALLFAVMFQAVYSLDFVPGIMAENGKMLGLFGMTKVVDLGHLVLGLLALISGIVSATAARVYFWALAVWYGIDVVMFFSSHLSSMPLILNFAINMPHFLITCAAVYIALKVDR